MSALGLQALLKPQIDVAFDLGSEIVRDCIFYKTESNEGTGLLSLAALSAPVKVLMTLYGRRDIDGLNILFGDEKLIVRASEMASITNPGAGDYLIEVLSGARHDVVTAHRDPTSTIWILQTRPVTGEDWGDLNPFSQSEDWSDLNAAVLFDDWQS